MTPPNPFDIQNLKTYSRPTLPIIAIARALAWLAAIVTFLNVLFFVLRASDPVISSDSWYFLDVFVSKAIKGDLGITDFFVKRHGLDHAQPLEKLLLLVELRFFDLDPVIEALAGVFGAATCALALYHLVKIVRRDKCSEITSYLAWATMCAILFSLNSTGVWTWPIVASGYVTLIPILIFMWSTWNAWRSQRYLLMAAATIFLGIVDDDNAIIAVAATLTALLVVAVCESRQQRGHLWGILAVVVTCMAMVRLGYAHAPVIGKTTNAPEPLAVHLRALLDLARRGDGWKWITIPLMLSVLPAKPLGGISSQTWLAIEVVATILLLISNALFWRKAFRGPYNLTKYIAVCLMVLSYGWIISIILYRVSQLGSNYLYQDRYVLIYQFDVIALLLMWAVTCESEITLQRWHQRLRQWVPAFCCITLLAIQIPLSLNAWHSRRYLISYYHEMAVQLENLANDPTQATDCLPELAVCKQPLDRRRALLQLLRGNHLDVFSSRVQKWHPFLPQWGEARENAASAVH